MNNLLISEFFKIELILGIVYILLLIININIKKYKKRKRG